MAQAKGEEGGPSSARKRFREKAWTPTPPMAAVAAAAAAGSGERSSLKRSLKSGDPSMVGRPSPPLFCDEAAKGGDLGSISIPSDSAPVDSSWRIGTEGRDDSERNVGTLGSDCEKTKGGLNPSPGWGDVTVPRNTYSSLAGQRNGSSLLSDGDLRHTVMRPWQPGLWKLGPRTTFIDDKTRHHHQTKVPTHTKPSPGEQERQKLTSSVKKGYQGVTETGD